MEELLYCPVEDEKPTKSVEFDWFEGISPEGENKLIVISREQTNPHYDPRLCTDGGGYDQPTYLMMLRYNGKLFRILLNNYSCGIFGTRFSIWADLDREYSAYWGTMDSWMNGSDFPIEENQSDIVKTFLDLYSKEFGSFYKIPLEDEFEDNDYEY